MASSLTLGIVIVIIVFGIIFFMFSENNRRRRGDDDKKDDDNKDDDEKDDDKKDDDRKDNRNLDNKINEYFSKVSDFKMVCEDLKRQIKDLLSLDPGYFDEWREIIDASNFLSAVNELDIMEKDILEMFKRVTDSDLFEKFTNKFYERISIKKEVESEMEGLLV